MSYFNEEQEDYMRSLDALPNSSRCWCGWSLVGECHNCPSDLTLADKMKVRCAECGNTPFEPGSNKITHYVTCSHARTKRCG